MRTVEEVEADLDRCLRELRAIPMGSNIMASSSLEYRVASLRKRKRDLE